MIQLLAGLWTTSISFAAYYEHLDDLVDVGIRWSLDSFGLDRLTYTARTRNKADLYHRLNNHNGLRSGLFSSWFMRPVSGWVISVEPAGAGRVRYDVRGPGAVRMEDAYATVIHAASTTVTTALDAMLTARVPAASATREIFSNSTQMGGVTPNLPVGDYPHEFVRKILAMSDSSNRIYDFWFVDEPFDSVGNPQKWTPYYQPRNITLSPLWQVWERDTAEGFSGARSIENLKTNVTIYYGTITGSVTSADATGVTLTDSGATFRSDGVIPGDRVTNITDGSHAQVESVTSETALVCSGLTGGSDDQWDSSDSYAISLQQPQSSTNSTASATYWARAYAETVPNMTSTQAAQYRDRLLDDNVPLQLDPFTVRSRTIKDDGFTDWPLWEVIVQGGGYVRLNDLYPSADSASQNGLTVFKITSLDYDHNSRSLRVGVDSPDRRLDARLYRAGILNGTLVQRGAAMI